MENLHPDEVHMYKLPGFADVDTIPESLKKLMMSDPSVVEYIKSIHENNKELNEADVESATSADVEA